MKVLITGGNGFLGRAFLRRARNEQWDWEITTMSRDESKIVKVQTAYPEFRTIKGDVSDDIDYLARLFMGFDVIIHAGANKLVDIGERSALEVVRNNVIGSEHVAKAAIKAGVKKVVGISSDKAVQPVNTYGMSKALMERIFQEADGLSDTEFTCPRYGNVVGSTISIVLYFQNQLEDMGFIKVTNPNMTRFYMGVDESIDTVLYSLNQAQRGSVVIPLMHAMSVKNVANLVLGNSPDTDIENNKLVRIVGERPGEKLHEALLHTQESVRVLPPISKMYYELRPPTEPPSRLPFLITSDKPPLGWMSFDRMKFLIKDAADV